VRAAGPDEHAVGDPHPVLRQPVRAVPDVGVRRRSRAHRPAGGRADRRGRRVQDLPPDRAPAARAGGGDGPALLVRIDLEQLLPAVDHAQGPRLVSADRRHPAVEQAGLDGRERRPHPEPRDHVRAADHRPADHRVPRSAAVLAVGPVAGGRQGLADNHPCTTVRRTMTILIDGEPREESALPHVWSRCIGAGRANEALRADWQRQFAEVVSACGVQYIRFHGIFHDDMFVYRGSYGGGFGPDTPLASPVYTFSYVNKVFDFLIDLGVRPFVEFGFMPRDLATETETLFWWGAHCS